MNPNKPLQRLGACSLVLSGALLAAQLKCGASLAQPHEQHQSQSQQQQPPPPTSQQNAQPAAEQAPPIGELPVKRRKVWTNDDVVSLRTPADDYLAEKEAKEAADRKAAAKEAATRAAIKSEKDPPLDIKLPATPEETEKMLKDTEGDIQEETEVLDKMRKEFQEAPTEQQEQEQKEIDRLSALIETSQRDLKALQEHLQRLRAKAQEENSTAPPSPPTTPPTPPLPQNPQ